MLAGIVVSNAILLVDYTNVLRRRDGMSLREAVERGGPHPAASDSDDHARDRFSVSCRWRSGIGEGAELQAPLARVVIGGLDRLDAGHARAGAERLHPLRRRLVRVAPRGGALELRAELDTRS